VVAHLDVHAALQFESERAERNNKLEAAKQLGSVR
jgi:hypothetical protein